MKKKEKEKNKPNKKEQETSSLPSSRFGSTLFFSGELTGEEDIVIDGNFHGKIRLKNYNLIIEKGAKVEAEIQAQDVLIYGEVIGNIFASGKVFISHEGQMKGNISATTISIMDGAQFRGSIHMATGASQHSPLSSESPFPA